jgi:hypothetical protein
MTDTLFVGYAPAFRGAADWSLDFRQSYAGANHSIIRRTVWQHAVERTRRIIVQVGEYRNARDAHDGLHLAIRETGIANESSVYVVRANLLIWAVSGGWKEIDVAPLLTPLLHELDDTLPSHGDEHLAFKRHSDWNDTPGAVCFSYEPKWDLGPSAWLAFKTTGATLERAREPGHLLAWPDKPGDRVSVTGWVVEPGRETYLGRSG